MREHDKAEWDGDRISMTAIYDHPIPHQTIYELKKCDAKSVECHYWIAADGECYGLTTPNGNSCIAIVEQMIHSAGVRQSYVTFANKNRAAWEAWIKKWSKRTREPAHGFGTIKVTVND